MMQHIEHAADHFRPHAALARALLPRIAPSDTAHDLSHILRVWRNVTRIAAVEGGNALHLTAATILHDCVNVPKGSDLRSQSSTLAAEAASEILAGLGWPQSDCGAVAHAIAAHSFSARIAPRTLEARILQDADRLDAIGHIGIARCFAVSGQMDRPLYDPIDPRAVGRDLDDTRFAIDHFRTKLLTLAGSFQTDTGKAMAAHRHTVIEAFLDGFLEDVSGSVTPPAITEDR